MLAIEAENGELIDPVEGAPSSDPDPERIAIAGERLAKVRKHFSGDSLAFLIIDAFAEGYAPGELAAVLGAPQREIETALRRIRRQANSHFPDWGTP